MVFFPRGIIFFWATPFSGYAYEEYSIDKALKASQLENRTYTIDGLATTLPDVSYVAEPVEGLWLLAIDGNVYLPRENGKTFDGPGIGHNRVVDHKQSPDRLGKPDRPRSKMA